MAEAVGSAERTVIALTAVVIIAQLAVKEKLCAIEETGTEGEHVDYRIHEVIRALDAEEEGTAGTVAKVHSRGMVYEGRVVAKAKVEAYKL